MNIILEGDEKADDDAESVVAKFSSIMDSENLKPAEAIDALKVLQSSARSRYRIRRELGRQGVCEELTKFTLRYIDNEEMTFECLTAMGELASSDNGNKCLLGAAGACDIITSLLKEPATSRRIVAKCMQLVVALASSKLPYIVAAAKKKDSAELDSARRTPKGISPMPSLSTVEHTEPPFFDTKLRFGDAGVCPVLVQSLNTLIATTPPGDRQFLCQICSAIASLAGNELNAEILGQQGVCASIVTCLRQHWSWSDKEDVEVVSTLLWTMVILCSDNSNGNKQALGRAGACARVYKSLREIIDGVAAKKVVAADVQPIVEHCLWALLNLSLRCRGNTDDVKHLADIQVTLNALILPTSFLKDKARAKATDLLKLIFPSDDTK